MNCTVRRRTNTSIELWFADLMEPARNALTISVEKNCLSVSAEYGGVFYDWLINLDAYPRRIGKGLYTDPLLMPEYQQNFESLFALRRHLLYEPLLHWTNTQLACAKWLGLYVERSSGTATMSSYAKLIKSESELDRHKHAESWLLSNLVRVDGTQSNSNRSHWDSSVLSLGRVV